MPVGVHVPVLPLGTPPIAVVATGLVQALELQSWKLRLPPVAAPGSLYVAVTLGMCAERAAPPRIVTLGRSGGVLSSVKLRVADHADWLPATSRPAALQ